MAKRMTYWSNLNGSQENIMFNVLKLSFFTIDPTVVLLVYDFEYTLVYRIYAFTSLLI